MRGVVLLVLLACGSSPVRAQATEHSIRVDCVALRAALQSFLAIETNLELDERPHTCMSSSVVQMFLRESASQFRIQQAGASNVTVSLADGDARFTEMLVLALIGRHYTAHFSESQTHFVFNTATQALTPRLPKCEYQKSFFILLLFVSIALLIFSMVVQKLGSIEKSAPRHEHSTGQAALPVSARMSIDFAPRRHGATAYTAVPAKA